MKRTIVGTIAALLGASAANGVSLGAGEGSAMRKATRQRLVPRNWVSRSKYQPHYGEQAAARNRSRM